MKPYIPRARRDPGEPPFLGGYPFDVVEEGEIATVPAELLDDDYAPPVRLRKKTTEKTATTTPSLAASFDDGDVEEIREATEDLRCVLYTGPRTTAFAW